MKHLSKKLLALFILSFSIISCGDDQQKEIDALNKVLMDGHDKVMPKSMGIAEVKKQLLEKVKDGSDSLKNEALNISTELQKAEDDMYVWMDNYGKAMNDVEDKTEKLKLYKNLGTEITDIATRTDNAIAKAKAMTGTPSN